MKILKKLFFFILIIFILYVLGLFVFTKEVKNFGDSIGLKNFNETILELKSKSDSVVNTEITIKNIGSSANEVLDNASNYAKDIKTKVDGVRSTASGIEHTYKNVKKQVDDTTKALDDANQKVQEIRQNFENVKNTFN